MVRAAVRAKALHEAHPVVPGHAPIGLLEQHVGVGKGERALLLDPVVAVVYVCRGAVWDRGGKERGVLICYGACLGGRFDHSQHIWKRGLGIQGLVWQASS